MNTKQAREIGSECARKLESGEIDQVLAILAPVLAQPAPFRLLDLIGGEIGSFGLAGINLLLSKIAALREEGCWVVIASALRANLDRDLSGALILCQRYIIEADVWYGADSMAERVSGEALVRDFNQTLAVLKAWRRSRNDWVRRAVGVSVHFWAKRSQGDAGLVVEAVQLLDLLEPLYSEKEMKAVKGIGWGLKTMGRNYPNLVEAFLVRQINTNRSCRTVMLRKAKTYLPEAAKERLQERAG
ncbi:MAG: DNA alkylation repair protein [Anaerolineales bacterium]|nr:DNA alkylation repair protein [Anaerolineales bacterium]